MVHAHTYLTYLLAAVIPLAIIAALPLLAAVAFALRPLVLAAALIAVVIVAIRPRRRGDEPLSTAPHQGGHARCPVARAGILPGR